MKKHITAWVLSLTFIVSGLTLAGCPERDTKDGKGTSICKQRDGSWKEC